MSDIISLGLKKGQLYETIVSTKNEDGTPNAAPMGLIVKSTQEVVFYFYPGSLTAANVKREGLFTVNILENPLTFVECTLGCPPASYFREDGDLFYLKSTDAYFTVRVTKEKVGPRKDRFGSTELTIIQARVENVVKLVECVHPLNRAIYGIMEALVNLTRMEMADTETKEVYLKRLSEISRLVNRVGGEEDKEALKRIQQKFDAYR
ncbi:MAG: DUF447 family protein [Methanobacteriaceae archaeon]|nr:DUF447 family protein [Methanobacteriaceae archaeon]